MMDIEFLETIRLYIIHQGGQNKAAKSLGVSAQYLSDVVNERRAIGPKILKGLGYEKHVEYIPVRSSK